MDNSSPHHKVFWLLSTFIVGFCLLFTGMRVSDLARPHRPKPSQRAIIENQVQNSQHAVKKTAEVFAVAAKPTEPRITVVNRSETLYELLSLGVPPLFPNSSRSPPTFSA